MAEKLNKDAVYRAAKTKEKSYFINDGGGLYGAKMPVICC